MAKKAGKKIKPTPEYDSERETRVLLEQIDQSVKTVAEQHGSIVKKLEEHDGRFDKIESELDSVKMAVIENSRGIRENSAKIDRVEKKLDTVTSDIEKRVRKLEVVR